MGSLAALLATTACQHHWTIDMRVEGTKVHREVIVDRHDGEPETPSFYQHFSGPPPSIVSRLESIYGNHTTRRRRGVNQVFEADFDGVLPDDVGGAGRVASMRCPFGVVTTYRERIGGTDQPSALLMHRMWAADRLADVLAATIEARTRAAAKPDDQPAVERVQAFLRGPFRSDVRDFALRWKPSTVSEKPDALLGFLVERGYLSAEEGALKTLAGVREHAALRFEFDDLGTAILRRVMRKGLGLPVGTPIPPPFDGLLFGESGLDAAARSLPGLVEELEHWRCPGTPAFETTHNLAATSPFAALVAEHYLGGGLFGDTATVEVTLTPPAAPFDTDGTLDRETHRIAWARAAVPSPYEEPLVFHASWAEPDVAWQTARFGSVLLDGKRLAIYLAWRATLAADDIARWDAAVATLEPGPDLKRTTATLRVGDGKVDPVFEGRRILLWALGDPPDPYREGDDPIK
jgi:hypothetical protein